MRKKPAEGARRQLDHTQLFNRLDNAGDLGFDTCLVLAGMSQGEEEEVKWNAELEVALFHSMHGHKPVGE